MDKDNNGTQVREIGRGVPISAFVTNLGKYNEGALVGEWLKLPATTEEVQALFGRIGIDGVRYEEFFITDYETDIDGLYDHLSEYASLDELNYLASLIEELDSGGQDKLAAAIELGDYTGSLQDIINLSQNLDGYELLSSVHEDSDLGYYWVEESGVYNLDDMGTLARYIDYERFGRDIRLDEGGTFTDSGYVRSEQGSFTEYYTGSVPEEYQVFAYPSVPSVVPMENPLAAAEMSAEQNYNMVDGRINNLPPEKSKPESILQKLAEAKIAVAEEKNTAPREKKPPEQERE